MTIVFAELNLVRGHVVASVKITSGKFDKDERYWIVGVDYQDNPDDIDNALCDPLRSYASEDEACDDLGDCQDNELGYDEFFVVRATDSQPPKIEIAISEEKVRQADRVYNTGDDACVVVNHLTNKVVFVSDLSGVKGYLAGARGAGVETELSTHEYNTLSDTFVMTGFSYADPQTGVGLWLLRDASIADDGVHYAADAVDIKGHPYLIEWDCIEYDLDCDGRAYDVDDESNACDWDKYTVTAL